MRESPKLEYIHDHQLKHNQSEYPSSQIQPKIEFMGSTRSKLHEKYSHFFDDIDDQHADHSIRSSNNSSFMNSETNRKQNNSQLRPASSSPSKNLQINQMESQPSNDRLSSRFQQQYVAANLPKITELFEDAHGTQYSLGVQKTKLNHDTNSENSNPSFSSNNSINSDSQHKYSYNDKLFYDRKGQSQEAQLSEIVRELKQDELQQNSRNHIRRNSNNKSTGKWGVTDKSLAEILQINNHQLGDLQPSKKNNNLINHSSSPMQYNPHFSSRNTNNIKITTSRSSNSHDASHNYNNNNSFDYRTQGNNSIINLNINNNIQLDRQRIKFYDSCVPRSMQIMNNPYSLLKHRMASQHKSLNQSIVQLSDLTKQLRFNNLA